MRSFERDMSFVSNGASLSEYYTTFCSLEARAQDDARVVEDCELSSPDFPHFTLNFSFTGAAGEIISENDISFIMLDHG